MNAQALVLAPCVPARNGKWWRITDTQICPETPPCVQVKFHLEDLKGLGAHIFPIGDGNRGWIGKRNGEISGSKQLHVEPWDSMRER